VPHGGTVGYRTVREGRTGGKTKRKHAGLVLGRPAGAGIPRTPGSLLGGVWRTTLVGLHGGSTGSTSTLLGIFSEPVRRRDRSVLVYIWVMWVKKGQKG